MTIENNNYLLILRGTFLLLNHWGLNYDKTRSFSDLRTKVDEE